MPPEKENKKPDNKIRTFSEDMALAVKEGQAGLLKNIITEQERIDLEKRKKSPERARNKFFLIAGIILLVASVGAISFFLFFRDYIDSVDVVTEFVPMIFTDETQFISVDGLTPREIADLVTVEVDSIEIKFGGVMGLYLTEDKKVIDFDRFVELGGINLRVSGTRLVADNFFMGILGVDSNVGARVAGDLFILLKIESLTDIFPFIKNWEEKMFVDLRDFWGIPTGLDTEYLLSKSFEDGIVENKNARVLYDNQGKIVLMYVFLDDKSIIITDSRSAVREAVLRLGAGEIRR